VVFWCSLTCKPRLFDRLVFAKRTVDLWDFNMQSSTQNRSNESVRAVARQLDDILFVLLAGLWFRSAYKHGSKRDFNKWLKTTNLTNERLKLIEVCQKTLAWATYWGGSDHSSCIVSTKQRALSARSLPKSAESSARTSSCWRMYIHALRLYLSQPHLHDKVAAEPMQSSLLLTILHCQHNRAHTTAPSLSTSLEKTLLKFCCCVLVRQ